MSWMRYKLRLLSYKSVGGFFSFLVQQNDLDVGQDTSFGNGDTSQEFVQLFIVADGKLKMTGNDAILLVQSKNETMVELYYFMRQII